jgi:hypothetical protein
MTTYTKEKNAVPKHDMIVFLLTGYSRIILQGRLLKLKFRAQPYMFGMMQHSNPFINLFVSKLLAILNLKWNGSVIPSNKKLLRNSNF